MWTWNLETEHVHVLIRNCRILFSQPIKKLWQRSYACMRKKKLTCLMFTWEQETLICFMLTMRTGNFYVFYVHMRTWNFDVFYVHMRTGNFEVFYVHMRTGNSDALQRDTIQYIQEGVSKDQETRQFQQMRNCMIQSSYIQNVLKRILQVGLYGNIRKANLKVPSAHKYNPVMITALW